MKNWTKGALLASAMITTAACAAPTDGEGQGEGEGEVGSTSAALTSGLVATRPVDGIVMSTGNIYFTSHDATGASVWRTAQTSSPGQELPLYTEAGARFGDIVWAQVGGIYWGYFLAQVGGTTTVRRVSLAGGSASVLATVSGNIDIANTHRNLVTDGTSLFFQTDVGVYQVSVNGGTPARIATTSPNTPTAGLALKSGALIYADVATIYSYSIAGVRLPIRGGGYHTYHFTTVVATAPIMVTTLYAVSNGVYWGARDGVVRLTLDSGSTTTMPGTGLLPTSIGTNGYTAGAAQLWTQCGNSSCTLQHAFPVTNWSTTIGANAFGAAVNSNGNGFYADSAGIHREVY